MKKKTSQKTALIRVSHKTGDFVFSKLKGHASWPSIVREIKGTQLLVDFICPEKTW